MQRKFEIMTSIKGVGTTLSAILLADMQEFGEIEGKQASSRRVGEDVYHPHPSQTRTCTFRASGSS